MAVLYGLALVTAYSAGVYFLFPYYSIQPGETHFNGPVPMTWADGEYLLSLKTVAQQSTLLSDLELVLGVRAILLSNVTSDRSCPPGFFYSDHRHAGRDEPCEYVQLHEFNFLGFALEYDTLAPGYQGLTERPEDVELLPFNIISPPRAGVVWTHNSVFLVELLRFAAKGSCRTLDDCQDFIADVARNREGLPYVPGSVQCVRPSMAGLGNSTLSGCAVALRLGTSKECFPDDSYVMQCDFAMFFNFFVRPAEIFLVGDMWKWGTILFVSSMFLWGVVSMLHGRRLHLQYLRYYYLTPSHLYLEEGATFDLKMTLIGQQFTKRSGIFRVYDASSAMREVIFHMPLRISFGEEDVEGEKVARNLQRTTFTHTKGSCLAEFRINWADDFTSAYVTVPHLQLEIRQQIPARVKTPWNLVFIFPFFLVGLLFRRPAPSQLLRYRHYLCVVAFVTSVQMTWLIVVVFAALSFSSHASFLRSWVWGSMEERPWGSLVLFLAFLLFVFISLLAHFICLSILSELKPKPKVNTDDYTRMSSSIAINPEEDDYYNHGMNGSTNHLQHHEDTDFSTIEFVPLMSSTTLASSSSSATTTSPTPPPSAKARLFASTDDYHFTPESSPNASPVPLRRASRTASVGALEPPIAL